MADKKYEDRLGGYTQVKDRIRLFLEAHPDGRLVTAEVRWPQPGDDVSRIAVKALAYRTADDPLPGVGWSWMLLPGTTPYTRGSELENTETSAWGRAIGALGIGIGESIATGDEISAKGGEVRADVDRGDDGSLIGIVEVGDKVSSDFQLRQTPDGPEIGFRLRGGKGGILVEAYGPLALQLDQHREAVVGKRVTVWGAISPRTFTPKGGNKAITYQVLAADRVRVPEVGDLPNPDVAPAGLTEAESEALWATIDGLGV
jgi:hypothetical protein